MNPVAGIIFSNMHDHNISDLTAHRCMGSIPVGGRYRLIDFTLSGFVNAGITSVGVITKSNYQSLMDHLGDGREWDLSRKKGGLVILPPFGRVQTGMYHGRIEALAGIMSYIQDTGAEYVLLADCDIMANIDFSDFIQDHIDSGMDISLMYKRMDVAHANARDLSVLFLKENSELLDNIRLNPIVNGEHNVYLNIMMVSRKYLEKTIMEVVNRNHTSFEENVLKVAIDKGRVRGHHFSGYVSRFDSLGTYFASNIALLKKETRDALFPHERPIYTKVRDEAPVRYGLDSQVHNTLLADGCQIEGEVTNSILFRGVKVDKGAKVNNCILMQHTHIKSGADLSYVITDKDVTVSKDLLINGIAASPVYISKGSVL